MAGHRRHGGRGVAADDAVDGLTLPVPKTSRVFVDDSYFRAESAPYAVSAIRESLSKGGHALARTREEADVIFEIRAGALSLEQMRRVFGVPEMRIPINDSFNVVSLPELSVYSRRDRVGVAEFSGFLYDAETGQPLGVIDPTGAYIGGASKMNLNAELYFPVPGTGNDKSLRIFAFADAGNVWREGERIDADSIRASAGLGLSWISPVGPLKLSYGTPLRSKPTDRIQRFQFQIGTAF